MIHAGVGADQINTILASLNIPPVSYQTIADQQTEAGKVIEEVAMSSTNEWLQEEVRLSQNKMIDVSVDAGWQKRGSGKSYDSLSGHCSMIDSLTGKVVDFAVRSKQCRTCERTSTKEHDCRKNWAGSSKAIEPDMVVEMLERTQKKVYERIGISPGSYTSKLFTLRDIQRKKKNAISVTLKAKRNRLSSRRQNITYHTDSLQTW